MGSKGGVRVELTVSEGAYKHLSCQRQRADGQWVQPSAEHRDVLEGPEVRGEGGRLRVDSRPTHLKQGQGKSCWQRSRGTPGPSSAIATRKEEAVPSQVADERVT